MLIRRDNCRYVYVSNPKCCGEKVDKPHKSYLNSSNAYCYVWYFISVKMFIDTNQSGK